MHAGKQGVFSEKQGLGPRLVSSCRHCSDTVASCRWGSGLSTVGLPSAMKPTALRRSHLLFLIQKTLWAISLWVTRLDHTWAALEQGWGNGEQGRWESGPADDLSCI